MRRNTNRAKPDNNSFKIIPFQSRKPTLECDRYGPSPAFQAVFASPNWNTPGLIAGSTLTGITLFGGYFPSSSSFDSGFSIRCWRTLEQASTIHGVEAHLGQLFHRSGRHFQMQIHLGQSLLQQFELNARNRFDVLRVECMISSRRSGSGIPDGSCSSTRPTASLMSSVLTHHALDELRADVAGHDDYGVLEVHRTALTIGPAATSSACSSTLNTSGWAFSTSSSRITL